MLSELLVGIGLSEIRWHGRGGQGAITAAKILAEAAFLEGHRGVTAAPSFGAERRGAPVSASTRISPEPVIIVSQIEKPDVVVVLDETLLKYREVTTGLKEGGWLIINSRRSPEEFRNGEEFKIATADATGICLEAGLKVAGLTVVNTAILGAIVRATRVVEMASIETVVRHRFLDGAINLNLGVIHETHDSTKLENWYFEQERADERVRAYMR